MWEHPVTSKHLNVIAQDYNWFDILPTQVKPLACGDVGQGAMCEWTLVVSRLIAHIDDLRTYNGRI